MRNSREDGGGKGSVAGAVDHDTYGRLWPLLPALFHIQSSRDSFSSRCFGFPPFLIAAETTVATVLPPPSPPSSLISPPVENAWVIHLPPSLPRCVFVFATTLPGQFSSPPLIPVSRAAPTRTHARTTPARGVLGLVGLVLRICVGRVGGEEGEAEGSGVSLRTGFGGRH